MQTSAEFKTKWKWFIPVALLIMISNYSAHHLLTLPPEDQYWMTVGTLIDFVVVLPLLAYVMILRKKRSITPILGVALAGFFVGKMMLPDGRLAGMEWVGWVLVTGEAALFAAEIWIIFSLFRWVRKVKADLHAEKGILPPAMALSLKADQQFAGNRLANILMTEYQLIRHALFSWRKKAPASPQHFTAHKKTSVIAFYIMLIHAIVLETVGVHWLIHSINPMLSWVLLLLNVYTVLFFIGEIHAIRLNPITVEHHQVSIQMGLMKRIHVPFASIQAMKAPEHGEYNEHDKTAFHGLYADLEKGEPHLVIELKEPLQAKSMYGITKQVEKIYLRLDDPAAFTAMIKAKMEE
ncbi:hypothetical protein JOC78_001583 [Bacillus ectoiniformans]|uniref:hypothetical protein n=1 Tax=Bacillus ectoiniformans TaxID=1494429 RepID=UPI0019598920|nr:hypothetical protein [Bacillus ectoiniformans]MBM7648637.1 hypothetical protein [Bacillus ectoiniformans]